MEYYTNVQTMNGRLKIRGYKDGHRFNETVNFKPTLYVPTQNESDYRSIAGDLVAPVVLDSISEARKFIDKYKDVENFPVFGQTSFQHAYLNERYPQDEIVWNIDDLRILFLDIEVASDNGFPNPELANEEVTAISLMNRATKEVVCWGMKDYEPHYENITYHKCDGEKRLLTQFLAYWTQNYPDVVSGWNIENFDIVYLVNRIKKLFNEEVAETLAPWGIRSRMVRGKYDDESEVYELDGIAILDYLPLYKKFTYVRRENYKLGHIGQVELGEGKVEYDGFLHDLYKQDFQKFMEYNVKDTWLVWKLDQKLRILEVVFTMAYDAKINYREVLSPIKFWDTLICNHLIKQKIAVPQQIKHKRAKYEGAYVKEPIVGRHQWLVGFDATSLYPSQILQYNISPDTILSEMKDVTVEGIIDKAYRFDEKTFGVAANGACFRNDKEGFFPALVARFFADRQKFKKKYLAAKNRFEHTHDPIDGEEAARFKVYQEARKISLNSLYGAVGSPNFRFHSLEQAEAITKSGQMVIKWMEKAVDAYLNKLLGHEDDPRSYVVYCDTDSVYITLDELVQKVFPTWVPPEKIVDFLDKVCKEKLSKVLDAACEDIASYTNAFKNAISFKREKIADAGIWTAKKRYVLRVYDDEGVRFEHPETKVTGLEVVRSSTPAVVRDMLKQAFALCLDGKEKELWQFVDDQEIKFRTFSAEEIAFPRSVNGLDKYSDATNIYKKGEGIGTPIHVRASLLYNHMVKQNGLDRKYRLIQEGDNIHFILLKVPNRLRENVIAFTAVLPHELGLNNLIDYDIMFSKTFKEPLDSLLICLKWNLEQKNTIDTLFGE